MKYPKKEEIRDDAMQLMIDVRSYILGHLKKKPVAKIDYSVDLILDALSENSHYRGKVMTGSRSIKDKVGPTLYKRWGAGSRTAIENLEEKVRKLQNYLRLIEKTPF